MISQNKEYPLVSIITPTLNSEKYIRETISSIKGQTYKNIEHIIIDGGSVDRTLNIVNEFHDIRLISGKDNGMYDAINKGLKIARGSILSFLNSDDLYLPNTIKNVISAFSSDDNPDVIYGDCDYIDSQGQKLYTYYSPKFSWDLLTYRPGFAIATQTIFWRREIVNDYGYFDTAYKLSGDYEYFLRIAKMSRVRHCGKVLAKFRQHENSLSATLIGEMSRETIDIWNRYKGNNEKHLYKIYFSKVILKLRNWHIFCRKQYWQSFYYKHLK